MSLTDEKPTCPVTAELCWEEGGVWPEAVNLIKAQIELSLNKGQLLLISGAGLVPVNSPCPLPGSLVPKDASPQDH